jgi:hypothetical protein
MQLVQRRRFATNRDGMWAQLEAAALATIGEKKADSLINALKFA